MNLRNTCVCLFAFAFSFVVAPSLAFASVESTMQAVQSHLTLTYPQ